MNCLRVACLSGLVEINLQMNVRQVAFLAQWGLLLTTEREKAVERYSHMSPREIVLEDSLPNSWLIHVLVSCCVP